MELVDYDALGLLVQEQGAVAGKAYPELGFALIRLGPETDPARVVEFLGVDPRVRSAELQFEPAIRRPAIIRGDGIPFRSGSDTMLSPAETKDSFSSNLFAYTSLYRSTEFSVEVTVVNSGLARSEPASLRAELVALVPDESTADPEFGWGYRMDASDPFNFDSTGGHGTSVAGLIAGSADNSIGGIRPRKASYASAGPNLWITAPAGEYGFSRPALLTVDQMGTDRGIGILRDDNPLQGQPVANPYGDYTGRMNGTSASAPLVSGAVAVLLETEPALTWRDVKHILAKTARKIDPDIMAAEETIGTIARTLRLPWTENAAGYDYHDWYGFGALDLDAAVEMAGDYTPDSLGEFHQSGWFESGLSGAIPDNDGTGLTRTLNVSTLPDDANIEAVLLEVDIDHDFPNDLGIHLVSPQGTRAVLNQVFNETLALDEPGNLRWRLLGNAFYGETPNGDWQIEVFDAAEDDTGDLEAWRLRFYYGSHPEEEE